MKNSDYNIIETSVSKDEQKVYFILHERETIDDINASSFSISAAAPAGITTVKDVSTDKETAYKILKSLTNESISPENIQAYILNFLSES